MTAGTYGSTQIRTALADLSEARKILWGVDHEDKQEHPGNHKHLGIPWWQIEEACRDLGHISRGEKNPTSTPRYQPLTSGARRIPAGTIDELLGDLPADFDHRLRQVLVRLVHADRTLASATETPAIADARLRIGAAWMLLLGEVRR
jgi:hypothetical protein